MKLGNDTIDELFRAMENRLTNAELQSVLLRFSITGWDKEITSPKMIVKAIPYVQKVLNGTDSMAQLTAHVLGLINAKLNTGDRNGVLLFDVHPTLYNTLLRDGYDANDFLLKRIVPQELSDQNVPDELLSNLVYYGLSVAIGHLEQAQENYRNGNWAAANAMVRSCFEAVLIFINKRLNPTATGSSNPIDQLTALGFFREDLNEADKAKQAYGFVGGFWKMLHPHGSHPGLSEEEDSTFRYHIALVTLNYYLKRLKKLSP